MDRLNLHRREEGKRCFILANGPSLITHNLSLLKNEITIGINNSTLLEKNYDFKQTYYTVSDLRFLKSPQKRDSACGLLSENTIRVVRRDLFSEDDHTLKNKTVYIRVLGRDGFQTNIHHGYYFGCTTTMLALQLAVTLGCPNIYLLGLDLTNYFSTDNIRFYSEKTTQEFDLFISTQIFNIATAYENMKSMGIHVYHCNKESLISPYIPFINYDSLF